MKRQRFEMWFRRGVGVVALCGGLSASTLAQETRPSELSPEPIGASQQIPPQVQQLLEAKCIKCHGGEATKAELALSSLSAIERGGESGPVVVWGAPDKSLLIEKVLAGEMPPDGADPLSSDELRAIEQWIARGQTRVPGALSEASTVEPAVSQHDIVPMMLRRCSACHGLHRREADLDLRSRAAMLRGGKSGPAIVLGDPTASRVMQRIHAGEMPPLDMLTDVSIKPIDAVEIEQLSRWIALGAPELASEPDVATTEPDPLVSDADREYWAFRAPARAELPQVQAVARVRNAIDRFILRDLERAGLGLAPEADRTTLIRRVSFDLTGLPPNPSEVQLFVADLAPDAYERLVDRLLASPRYGERWARYWLDLAGYADSEGKREQDLPRPHAWRYRDYVIRSLNADKPFDRFLMEQIAGDELADYANAPEITAELYENLVATGFLRMAPDATWANLTGYLPDRVEVIADEIDVFGSAILGLTLKCARCHSHKFDPIPQRDYYRLIDIFKGALDEYDWMKPDIPRQNPALSKDVLGGRHLPYVTTAERQAWQTHEARISAEIGAIRATLADPAQPSTEQAHRLAELESQRRPEPRVQALWDRGTPSPTYIYRRGDPFNPGRWVGPGVPSALTDGRTPFEVTPPWPGAQSTGRRLALAKWLTKPDHPLTARVQMNRLWKQHFGHGIVMTLGNFGKAGSPPTHPELLDWLSLEFTRQDWSLKSMQRLMLTSSTYRQSSNVSEARRVADPANVLFGRMPLVRLDAEALYDALLQVAGQLNERGGGPADGVKVSSDGMVTPVPNAGGWRRLIYVEQTRKQVVTHRENFDFPQMNPNCVERRDSLVAPQALHLLNHELVWHLAEQLATRVLAQAPTDSSDQVHAAYWLALSRAPSDTEASLTLNALQQLQTHWASAAANGHSLASSAVRLKALTTVCHALLNSAGFLYVD